MRAFLWLAAAGLLSAPAFAEAEADSAAAFAADSSPAGAARRVATLIESCRLVIRDSAAFDAEARRLGLVPANEGTAWMSEAAGRAGLFNPEPDLCFIQSNGDGALLRRAVLDAMAPIAGAFLLPPPAHAPTGWDNVDAWRVCNADGAYVITSRTRRDAGGLPSIFVQLAATVPAPDPCPTELAVPAPPKRRPPEEGRNSG